MDTLNSTTISKLISQVLKDTGASSDTENALVGIFTILYYKSLLEILFSFQNDDKFPQRLIDFFAEEINKLNSENQSKLQELMGKQKENILLEVLKSFQSQLPKEVVEKIDNNIRESLVK